MNKEWKKARLHKNLFMTATLMLILYIGNAVNWKVTSTSMFIGLLVGMVIYHFISNALQAKIDRYKELDLEKSHG